MIGLYKAVGLTGAANVLIRRLLRVSGTVRSQLCDYSMSFEINPADSDLFVIAQIFGHREYALPPAWTERLVALSQRWVGEGKIPIIVDGGANAGYSALFFANLFIDAIVLAVEPDLHTYQALVRNCAGNPRIRPIHAALWSHGEGVRLALSGKGSWSNAVSEQGVMSPSITLAALLGEEPTWSPLIVKLDIEGAEKTVVAAAADVFRTVPCIMIEPHDYLLPGTACLAPLFAILADRPMDTLINGENLILLDPNFDPNFDRTATRLRPGATVD